MTRGPGRTPPPVRLTLWVVPYAGRYPPNVVGRARCRVASSNHGMETRGPHGVGCAAPQVGRLAAASPLRDRTYMYQANGRTDHAQVDGRHSP